MRAQDERDTTQPADGAEAPIGDQPDELTFEVTDLATGSRQPHPLAPEASAGARSAQPAQPAQRTRLIQVSHTPTRVTLTLDARALRIGLAAVALLLVAGIAISNLPRLGPQVGHSGWFAYVPLSSPTPQVVSQSGASIGITMDPSQPSVIAPTPTIPLQALGPIPSDCAPNRTDSSVGAPGLGTAVGHDPVWVDAFDGPTATLSIPAHGGTQFTQYGWQVGIVLVFTTGYSAPVTLSGNAAKTNLPLWFGALNPLADPGINTQAPTTDFTIDAQQAQTNGGGVSGDIVFYQVAMYLPGAGCYTLGANWPGGRWLIGFAAGA
ncbi:MAG TPA: hypothetical protein VMV29_19220 [Ktedonobacterales bacterium]|nr:hypothetical protein [Ktedonobacterales bacterium]